MVTEPQKTGPPKKLVYGVTTEGLQWVAKVSQQSRLSSSYARSRCQSDKARTSPWPAGKIAMTEQTYYRWRKEYGGMGTDQLKRLKELEKENARLRRAVADMSLEKIILAEAAKGNF
mgnify:CR=1 FL=1